MLTQCMLVALGAVPADSCAPATAAAAVAVVGAAAVVARAAAGAAAWRVCDSRIKQRAVSSEVFV